jgi:hypothetical protein
MEALTRLVSDSLARQGLDRPVDPRRLQWSRWFRCDSPHSLLVVPSKPGIFALAEKILEPGLATVPGAADALVRRQADQEFPSAGAALQRCDSGRPLGAASAAEMTSKRMLAVLQFSEDDNMAFVLDRMFAYSNPMRARLQAGNCFVRFVVVEDQQQRRTICAALNQWMRNSAEKATGLPADFSSSLELASENVAWGRHTANIFAAATRTNVATTNAETKKNTQLQPDSGANKNLHCPQPFPSGF